ncbi:hypothetical protein V6N13_005808 [Hibiscus sabdariffa]
MTTTSCVFPPMSSFYTPIVLASQSSTYPFGSNKAMHVTPIPSAPVTIFPSSSPNVFPSAPTSFAVSPFSQPDQVNCFSDQDSSSSGFPIVMPSSSPSASTSSFPVCVQVREEVHEPSPPLSPGLHVTQLNNIGSIQCQSPMLVQRLSPVLPQARGDSHGNGPVLNNLAPHLTDCHAKNQRVVSVTHKSNSDQAASIVPHPNPCVYSDNNLGTEEVFGDCISAKSLGDFSNNTENLVHDETLERSSPLSGVNLDEFQLGLPAQSGIGISYSLADLDTSTTTPIAASSHIGDQGSS